MNACKILASCLVALIAFVNNAHAEAERPDIVFIIVDDLNDWLGCLARGEEGA